MGSADFGVRREAPTFDVQPSRQRASHEKTETHGHKEGSQGGSPGKESYYEEEAEQKLQARHHHRRRVFPAGREELISGQGLQKLKGFIDFHAAGNQKGRAQHDSGRGDDGLFLKGVFQKG